MISNPLYPTYTIFSAVVASCAITLVIMPFFIRFMRRGGIGQQIRADGPKRHLIKQGTPTMGGAVMIFAVLVTCFLFGSSSMEMYLLVGATLVTAVLGLTDDIASVANERSLGLTPSQKMAGLIVISITFCLLAVNCCTIAPVVYIPGGFTINLGVLETSLVLFGHTCRVPWLYLFFVFLLLAGMSNAVNLTDGLDGLAGGTVLVVMLVMAMVAYIFDELQLAIFAAACAGACVGFLWFNCYPASIFMGDTGSLALGAAFAALAVLTKTEMVSLVMGGLFVMEALSVIIQVTSFKMTGKRVFLMAPLHHHFEKMGWSETKVVVRFCIVAAALATLGFVLLFQLR